MNIKSIFDFDDKIEKALKSKLLPGTIIYINPKYYKKLLILNRKVFEDFKYETHWPYGESYKIKLSHKIKDNDLELRWW